jgi:hypothetical protein
MKAALYACVCTNEQPEESIDDQFRECRELCRRHGFRVVGEFSDRGRSGNDTNRLAYQRLIKAARRHECDVIVAHQLCKWIHEVLMGDGADERVINAWRAESGRASADAECIASTEDDRLQELREQVSDLVDAVAHGPLRSSPGLADRLSALESKLAVSGNLITV